VIAFLFGFARQIKLATRQFLGARKLIQAHRFTVTYRKLYAPLKRKPRPSCWSVFIVAVIVVGSVGWLVFIAMLGVLIYYRRYAVSYTQ